MLQITPGQENINRIAERLILHDFVINAASQGNHKLNIV